MAGIYPIFVMRANLIETCLQLPCTSSTTSSPAKTCRQVFQTVSFHLRSDRNSAGVSKRFWTTDLAILPRICSICLRTNLLLPPLNRPLHPLSANTKVSHSPLAVSLPSHYRLKEQVKGHLRDSSLLHQRVIVSYPKALSVLQQPTLVRQS